MKRIVLCIFLAVSPALVWAAASEDPANLEQLRTAAQQGDAEAMLELGILYEFGYRLKDHNPPALAWYRLAAEAGNAKAGVRHDALKSKLSAQEMEEANKLYTEFAANLKKPAPAATVAPAVNAPTTPTPAKSEPTAMTPAPAANAPVVSAPATNASPAPGKTESVATPTSKTEEKKVPSSETK